MNGSSNLVHPTPIADLVPMRLALVHGVVVHYGSVYERPSADGGVLPVRTVHLRDATGEIRLALWDDQICHVQDADRVVLTEVWVKEYRGGPELAVGKKGKIINLGPASGRGPVWHPGPRESLYVWGLVRRRLRERDLKARAADAGHPVVRPAPPPPVPSTPHVEAASTVTAPLAPPVQGGA